MEALKPSPREQASEAMNKMVPNAHEPQHGVLHVMSWNADGVFRIQPVATSQGNIPRQEMDYLKTTLVQGQVSIFVFNGDCNKYSLPEAILAELDGISWTYSPPYLKASNGYFNCEAVWDTDNTISSVVTSTLFEAKQLQTNGHLYQWFRFNLIVSWNASTKQTRLFVMEAPPGFTARLSHLISDCLIGTGLEDPFWAVEMLVKIAVEVFDTTVWAVRDRVRNIEMLQIPSDQKPSPNYRYMHDLARHAIHVSEGLKVSLATVGSILRHHEDIIKAMPDRKSARAGKAIHARLQFMENILHSLWSRSDSNHQRLLNEMQLAFHTVAQYDSRVSVEITQSDSTAMRTVAFVTLSALPATFVSSIFSMSFFNFKSDETSGFISDKFWIFWIITIPLTISASVFCSYSRIVPSIGLKRRAPS